MQVGGCGSNFDQTGKINLRGYRLITFVIQKNKLIKKTMKLELTDN